MLTTVTPTLHISSSSVCPTKTAGEVGMNVDDFLLTNHADDATSDFLNWKELHKTSMTK